ncbi:MAG: aldehyde ferredoxin oxidoreductase family protein [Desulfobacteraceae bacterium]|jgi:aldehyde:ferredoxin oxidoreductase|nr:aldehyde ferredoxin oxidoreductase family protein [Desulfobacteraceae bacterium]
MNYGYTGRILHVDLTNRKIDIEEQDEAFFRSYLGGRGIGYHYLMKRVPPRTDPLSPENILVLATGIMTGSPLAASCRFAAVGKSPLTGTAAESEAAGFFGPELKKAGFDAVVFCGKSETPVYLFVNDGKAEIKDATAIYQLGSKEVEDAIRDELGSRTIRVAQTGLAGMNQVLYANITNNLGHFNGRNGFGALMGSKNLRAVAALGSENIPFFDRDFLSRTAKDYAASFRDNPLGEALYTYGTTAFPELLSAAGALPVNNFRRSALDDATPVSGDTYNTLLLQKRKGCFSCPIKCKRGIALDDPKYGIDSRYGGPEYETIAALGTNLNIVDLKAIAKGNEICNRYCMDTITAGMTIAFACECFEEGIITAEDTGGLQLRFGDADMMIQLLELIARREGFGDVLAQGSARLAKKWGVADKPCSLSVKGQELSMHDPRVKVGVGIGFAVSTYGADHMTAAHDPMFTDGNSSMFKSVKPLGIYKPMPATEISHEKVRGYMQLEKLWRMMDALGLCVFGFAPRGVMPLDVMVQSLNAITGWNASLYELLRAAERGSMLARAFNSREGFSINDDRLPARLFDPKPDGPAAGQKIFEEEDFNNAIALYYEMINCDPETGRPARGKLMELGLEWVEEMLEK